MTKLSLIAIATFELISFKACSAQTGGVNDTYAWQHVIAVGGTAQDSTTSRLWQDVVVFFSGTDGEIKWSTAKDTTNFNSRPYVPLVNGQTMRIGPQTKLYRWKFHTTGGDTGTFVMSGIKLGAKMFP